MRSPTGNLTRWPSLACRAVLLSWGCPHSGAAASHSRSWSSPAFPDPPSGRRRWPPEGSPRCLHPGRRSFATVPLSWHGCGRSRSPGPLGTWDRRHHACQLDGPDRRRRGLVRELAAFAMEMTLPAMVVSVIRAAAAGLPASGTKVIQRVLPAGQEGTAAGRHFLRNSTMAGSRGGRHLTMLPCRAKRRDGGGC